MHQAVFTWCLFKSDCNTGKLTLTLDSETAPENVPFFHKEYSRELAVYSPIKTWSILSLPVSRGSGPGVNGYLHSIYNDMCTPQMQLITWMKLGHSSTTRAVTCGIEVQRIPDPALLKGLLDIKKLLTRPKTRNYNAILATSSWNAPRVTMTNTIYCSSNVNRDWVRRNCRRSHKGQISTEAESRQRVISWKLTKNCNNLWRVLLKL